MAAAQDTPEEKPKSWREIVSVDQHQPPYVFNIESIDAGRIAIRIAGGPKGYHGQTIATDVNDDASPGFRVLDVNFDGHKDFAVVSNRGFTGNVSFKYWIFDRAKGIFRSAPKFDNITEVDRERRNLISYEKDGLAYRIWKYYHLVHGKPRLWKSVEDLHADKASDILPPDYPFHLITIVRFYRLGHVVRTFYSNRGE